MNGRSFSRLALALGLLAMALTGCVPGLTALVVGGAVGMWTSATRSVLPMVDSASDVPVAMTTDGGFVLGDPNAPVSILVFSDFACPHCVVYKTDVLDQLIREPVASGQARLELYIYPTRGGDLTTLAGHLLECAERLQPGSFLTTDALLYRLQTDGDYDESMGQRIADELGIDEATLTACADDASGVEASVHYGHALEIMGTPAVLIRYGRGEPQFIPGYEGGGVPYDVLADLIANAQ